jgi:prefoldin subunit 5
MLLRLQQEKDRMTDQFKDRLTDYESKLKRLEGERQRMDLEHSRVLREKEAQSDQARNVNVGLVQRIEQASEEIRMLQQQVRELQSKVAQLNAKR